MQSRNLFYTYSVKLDEQTQWPNSQRVATDGFCHFEDVLSLWHFKVANIVPKAVKSGLTTQVAACEMGRDGSDWHLRPRRDCDVWASFFCCC